MASFMRFDTNSTCMKKVLFISPTPTHPSTAGNRVHIRSLSDFLISKGFNVHFLYLAYENFDEKAMKALWGNRLHIIQRDHLLQSGSWLAYNYRRVYFKLCRIFRWLQKKAGIINTLQYQYNTEVDSHFPLYPKAFIKKLQQKEKFEVVICEYVFMSKALTFFDSGVLKILDTHDRFTDRYKLYIESNMNPEWISLFRDQEKKSLNRADLVLAVQQKEKEHFETLSTRTVIQFNYLPESHPLPEKAFGKKLMYFASDNAVNHTTLQFFIDAILPHILKKQPDVQLLVGGTICRGVSKKHPAVFLAGEYDNVQDFYASGDIFINPESKGTGYKIKTIEALAYGLPVVSTTAGAAGALEPAMDHLLIADDPVAFAGAVNRLIEQEGVRKNISENAKKWISHYKEKATANLYNHLVQIK
jgi:glycosyltransferase involved in cell wall biosynthesis